MNNDYFNPNLSNVVPNDNFKDYANSLKTDKITKKGDVLPQEESYIENILRQNKGKIANSK